MKLLVLVLCCVLAGTASIIPAAASSVSSRRSPPGLGFVGHRTPLHSAPTTAGASKDALGRLWGWLPEARKSCAYKDEQQQALSPDRPTVLQAWDAAAPCPEAPSPDNSAPDSVGRLWGVSWGRSCAFKNATGSPAFYSSFKPPSAAPAPAPSPSPLPAPAPVDRPRLPSPSPAVLRPPPSTSPVLPSPSPSPSPLPAPVAPSPKPAAAPSPVAPKPLPPVGASPKPSIPAANATAPAPASPAPAIPAPAGNSTSGPAACSCPPPQVVDPDRLATLIAGQLWRRLADSSNSYETSFSAAEAPNGTTSANTTTASAEPLRQPKQLPPLAWMSALMSTVKALEAQGVTAPLLAQLAAVADGGNGTTSTNAGTPTRPATPTITKAATPMRAPRSPPPGMDGIAEAPAPMQQPTDPRVSEWLQFMDAAPTNGTRSPSTGSSSSSTKVAGVQAAGGTTT